MRKVISICFLLLSLFLNGQRYNFKNYLVVNGLGSSSVNHIFQDSKGYIWFATQGGGASRFNGKEFKNFTKADGLISSDVTFITEDKKGNIWIATAEGASEFDGIRFLNYNQKNGLTNGVVYSIYAGDENKIWFALQDGGIRIYDGKKFDSLTVKDGLSSNEAYSITRDKQGNYWFGLSDGIAKYTKGKITNYSSFLIIKDKTFFSSLVDAHGNTWFGSTSGDVIVIHPDNTVEKLELPATLSHDFIGGITQDKKGDLWFATDHGLLKYSHQQFKLFGEREGLSVNTTQTVMADYEDKIWTGTLSGGANLLNSEAFVQYTEKDGLASRNVTAICREPSGTGYYVGTGEGLFFFNPEGGDQFKKITASKELEKVNISSLSIDKKGRLWLSAQEGIFIIEKAGTTYKLQKVYKEIEGNHIVSPLKIIHDKNGNCWVATYGSGIILINDKGAKIYNTKNGFYSDKILTVLEDSKSNIWFGTQDTGAIKYEAGKFQHVSLPDKAIWSIAEDKSGNLFFGTGESGLCRYSRKTFTSYTTKDGLLSDYIPALEWDEQNHCLWLGSEKGLEKLEFNTQYGIEKLHNYSGQDGFNSSAINQNGIWPDEKGLLWLSTVNGLWLFNSQLDVERNIPPKIQLTGIRLFYQKADWQKFANTIDHRLNLPIDPQLPHNKNHLTFDIQALTTGDVLYTYKLEGQDAEWSAPAKNNEVTYSNINPGSYTFRAKAINSDGKTSEEAIAFPFTINPPWWSTWWFRLMLIVVLTGALIGFIRMRESALRESNLKLEATVQQRTLEISHQKELVEETLMEKQGLLQEKEILLKEIHHRVKNNLQIISSMLLLQGAGLKDEQAKKAITESQNRVRSIALVHQKLYQNDGLDKVELNAFIKDLSEQIHSVYRDRTKEISIKHNIPETYILIDAAIPLGLILNELLTNSFKYAFNNTTTGTIIINLSVLENENRPTGNKLKSKKVRLSYKDSGLGMILPEDLENAPTLGLSLISLLSQQIGATLNYSNTNGSEFVFSFSINI